MLKFFKYLKPYKWQVLLLLFSVAVQTQSTLQLPTLMADIVNKGIVANDMSYVWITGFRMLGFALLTAFGAFLSNYFSARIGTAVSRDIRNDIFKKVMSLPIAEIDKFSTASLITRTTNDVQQVQQTVVLCLSMLLRVPMMAIGAIFQAIATAPNMTWIIALAVIVLFAMVTTIMSIVMPKFKIFQKLVDKITLLTRENLTGLRVIRAFNNEKLEQNKFLKANNDITKVNIFINNVMSLESPLMTVVFNGTSLLCIWIGISLIETDFSYLGNMMAFMQYATQVVMSFLFLIMLLVILPRANVSAGRINEVMNTKSKIRWQKHTVGTPTKAPSVEFKQVSFAYGNSDTDVLSDISFKAEAGKTTAFIGSTGSGKSTLVNLVPRFYEAKEGSILINGINIKDYAMSDLMQKIGYVPQRGILFSGNIQSNITFGNLTASSQEVERAAKVSQSLEFIKKLDDKYESHIAQGGTNVSGGQKQRLSIARAIAKNPEIYIFDDSFSALDMKTDANLRRELKSITQNSVVLLVAQRISTIKDADQIIVLDNGKIVGKGTHYQLLQNCPVYQEITRSQLSEKEFTKELKLAAKNKENQ